MKGYVVKCYIPTSTGEPSVDLIIKPTNRDIQLYSSEFMFNLNIEDAQDLVESLSASIDQMLGEDSNA